MPGSSNVSEEQEVAPFVDGLLGEVAQYFYDQSPRQSKIISFAGSIGYLAGICGNSHNVGTAGLNQYILIDNKQKKLIMVEERYYLKEYRFRLIRKLISGEKMEV